MSNNEDVIICRCEDVTLNEIQERISKGEHSLDEIKRSCRCGMGPCQGKNCMPLIAKEIAKATGGKISEIVQPTFRPPTVAIKMSSLIGVKQDD